MTSVAVNKIEDENEGLQRAQMWEVKLEESSKIVPTQTALTTLNKTQLYSIFTFSCL